VAVGEPGASTAPRPRGPKAGAALTFGGRWFTSITISAIPCSQFASVELLLGMPMSITETFVRGKLRFAVADQQVSAWDCAQLNPCRSQRDVIFPDES